MNNNNSIDVSTSQTARDAVRLDFNPSNCDRVTRIKIFAAAFITECEFLKGETSAKREVDIAITNIETAAMRAVKAATKDLK